MGGPGQHQAGQRQSQQVGARAHADRDHRGIGEVAGPVREIACQHFDPLPINAGTEDQHGKQADAREGEAGSEPHAPVAGDEQQGGPDQQVGLQRRQAADDDGGGQRSVTLHQMPGDRHADHHRQVDLPHADAVPKSRQRQRPGAQKHSTRPRIAAQGDGHETDIRGEPDPPLNLDRKPRVCPGQRREQQQRGRRVQVGVVSIGAGQPEGFRIDRIGIQPLQRRPAGGPERPEII